MNSIQSSNNGKEYNKTIALLFAIKVFCQHMYGKSYGDLCGCQHDEFVQDLKENKLTSTNYTKEFISADPNSTFNTENTTTTITSGHFIYNLKREIKEQVFKYLGFGNNHMDNMMIAVTNQQQGSIVT